jgi:F-type H+-transporting ATPase subunit epsilon
MAEKTMKLDIVSAERELFHGSVTFLSVTGGMGELGIHPGHTALLTALKPGQVRAQLAEGREEIFYISGGMLEVQPDLATILADTAFRAADLDEAAAKAAVDHAERILVERKAGIEYSTALTELAEASAQLKAIQMLRKRHRGER